MAMVTSGAGADIIDPVVQLISGVIHHEDSHHHGVIHHEDSHHILQIELGRMGMLLQDIGLFQYELKAPAPENVKIWFQLLHNCVAEAKPLLHRSGSRQRCLDSVTRNPRRFSKQVSQWKALFNHVFQGFETELFHHIVLSRNAINNHVVGPIISLLKDVINKEDEHQILQADFWRMESLIQFLQTSNIIPVSTLFQPQQKAPLLTSLQLLQTCLEMATRLLDRPEPRRKGCLNSVVHNPRKQISKEIREWNAFYDKVYHGFESELFLRIVSSRDAINNLVASIISLLNHVINKEDERQILQADFRPMESLLQDMNTLFRYESNITMTFFQPQQKAPLLTSLQLLQTCLAMAGRLLDRPEPRRKGCPDSVVHNPRKQISKEIRELNAFYDEVYHVFQSYMSMLVTSLHFLSTKPLYKEELIGEVGSEESIEMGAEESKEELMQPLSRDEAWMRFRRVAFKDDQVPVDIQERAVRFAEIQESIEMGTEESIEMGAEEAEESIEMGTEESIEMGAEEAEESIEMGSEESIEMGAEEPTRGWKRLIGEMQPRLSREEAWMQFRRVAFKDYQVPVDIQERAMRFAEECKGVPLGIKIVAAMIGQTSVDEWDACFSLKNNVDPSFPPTHPRLDAQLYALLRWSYDALPHSDVKNCFLYCAMYEEDEVIDSRQLVEMWIGEGLVKSKEGTHLMDMAIGRNYLKLLIDRCFFQIVEQSNTVFRKEWITGESGHDVFPSIRVHHGLIHDMAVYIAQKEENFLLMGSQNVRNFPEAGAVYENCTRMSMTIGDLPTDLRCPKLTTLILKDDTDLEELDTDLEELPSGFLLSLTSLRVLNLSGCTNITTSLPTVLGQLTLLQFLSLSDFPIPEEIGHLSNLQFLDLSCCGDLNSLPSQIGQLRNLKHLNLQYCTSLKMIPREISELTSLSRLLLSSETALSVEMEAAASIWSLKGLRSLTELDVAIDTKQPDGKSSRINDGIMGSWSEMRHLALNYKDNESSEEDLLPEDMQIMKKLQSFMLYGYEGLSLWNCKFEHLEMVWLCSCHGITALSPLEQMPNLKLLKLEECDNLRELGIGSPSGYVSLQKLVLKFLPNLESLGGGASQGGVWDERTVSQLRVLKMVECPSLRRFPRGMETLPNLCALIYQPWSSSTIHKSAMEWWESITWEDDNSKVKLQQIFIARNPKYKT